MLGFCQKRHVGLKVIYNILQEVQDLNYLNKAHLWDNFVGQNYNIVSWIPILPPITMLKLLTIFSCTTRLTANSSLQVCSIWYNTAHSTKRPFVFTYIMNSIFM